MTRPVRIANISGFYGDRFDAMQEMLAGPDPIDVLTGDYLAELTMFILWKVRERDPRAGYAATFLRQMEGALGPCLERGIRVVTNAGGLNPRGLAEALTELAGRLGRSPKIAYVEGDDVLPILPDLLRSGHSLSHLDTGQPLEGAGITPVTANAYLGGFGIAEALRSGQTSSSPLGSPMRRSWWDPPPGGTTGRRTIWIAWPARWSPGMSSNAVRRPPVATTASPTRKSQVSRCPAFPLRRSVRTGISRSPSNREPAAQ